MKRLSLPNSIGDNKLTTDATGIAIKYNDAVTDRNGFRQIMGDENRCFAKLF
ncbi:hypothetical protein D3C76_1712120 [compost metagenome]